MNNILKNIIEKKDKYNIHFVGIGGVSMFYLAMSLKKLGHEVTGSDLQKSKNTKTLEGAGIRVIYKHAKENINHADCVVYSFAVENGVEVKEAKKLNIPCFCRAELLGEILKQYKTSICVAGAHGKTTTTALIFYILKTAGYSVDLHLGGSLVENGNYNKLTTAKSTKDYIVCEACEYKDAFLYLKPNIAVVTNIAEEHLDYFKSFDNVKKSFNMFSKNANMLICSPLHELENKNKVIFLENEQKTLKNLSNYNLNVFFAKKLKMLDDGTYSFDCIKNNNLYGRFCVNLIGKHNVTNAVSAICVADYLGIKKLHIKTALKNFAGIERRFEILNKQKFIVHDYAHHPDEINAVIQETLNFFKGKLCVVFQPHTFSRTKNLMQKFVDCFKNLEDVVIYKTYSARERYLKSGSAKTLAQNIGNNAIYLKSKPKIVEYLRKKVELGYGVLLLGAGDIYEIAKNVNKLC